MFIIQPGCAVKLPPLIANSYNSGLSMKTVHHILLLMILLTFEACRPKTIERRGRSIDVTAIVVPYNLERTEQSLLRAAGMRHFPRNGFPAGYFAVPGMGTFPLYPLDPVRERLRPEQIDYRQRRPRNLSLERFVKAAPASHV